MTADEYHKTMEEKDLKDKKAAEKIGNKKAGQKSKRGRRRMHKETTESRKRKAQNGQQSGKVRLSE